MSTNAGKFWGLATIGAAALLLGCAGSDAGTGSGSGLPVNGGATALAGASAAAGFGVSGTGAAGAGIATAGGMGASGFGAAGTGAGVGAAGTGVSGTGAAGAGVSGTGAAGATAGTGTAGITAGTGAAGTTAGTGAAGTAATTGGTGAPLTGPAPPLPPIEGECPEFVDGSTISVAGHGGILILAGPPGMGGPLLFYWHGTGGSASEATRTLPAEVRNDIISSGGIIASFNGNQSSGAEGDCSGTNAHNIADFHAADQIAACAVQNHGIDPRRIYTTGCSAGGLQSGCMAMRRSSYLAAAAPNSGGITFPQPWEDDHTPAIFTMHGGTSDMVIIYFSDSSQSLDQAAKDHGGFVVNCDHGGGHCRAPAELQVAAWDFMKAHPWGVDPSPWAGGIPAGVPSYCTIF